MSEFRKKFIFHHSNVLIHKTLLVLDFPTQKGTPYSVLSDFWYLPMHQRFTSVDNKQIRNCIKKQHFITWESIPLKTNS